MDISISNMMANLGDSPGQGCDALLFIYIDCIDVIRTFFRVLFMTDGGPFLLDTLVGHQFALTLLKMHTTQPVHDYILEGLVQVLSIVKTGSSQISSFSSHILFMSFKSSLMQQPPLSPH
jgi:hypothetical protein